MPSTLLPSVASLTRRPSGVWVLAAVFVISVATHLMGQFSGSVATVPTRGSNPSILPRQSAGAGQVANLKAQLEKGLRARRDNEFAYIAQVVELVERRQLPVKLVTETFHYARSKRGYPFQYFQRALKLRAAKLGVTIEPV